MTKKPLMLDTQLLVLLTIGATDWRLIRRHKRTENKYTRADFNLLLEIVAYDPRFIFCAHVAAETSNLVGQHREPDRSRIMRVLKALLSNATEIRIDSHTALEDPSFVPLGPADAAQLVSCTGSTVLLTDDEPLFNAATARGSTTIFFREERLLRNQAPDS